MGTLEGQKQEILEAKEDDFIKLRVFLSFCSTFGLPTEFLHR